MIIQLPNYYCIFESGAGVKCLFVGASFAGNGYIAASFDSRNGLYIRLNRALSLEVPFYPVVGTSIESERKEGLFLWIFNEL